MKEMNCLKVILSWTLSILSLYSATAQHAISDSLVSFPFIGATGTYQLPGGELADRFGNNFSVGGVFQWKMRNNLMLGIEGDFIFGEQVKENHFLDHFKTPDGNLINSNGNYTFVALSERGYKFEFKAGKIFSIAGPNKNSGILLQPGIGFLQHKIRFDTPSGSIPYLEGEYRKGFDKLSNGVCLSGFLGYLHFSNKKLINYFAGFEITRGFTRNKRNQNFDTGLGDDHLRNDIFYGIRLGWIFPIYKRMADKIYFN